MSPVIPTLPVTSARRWVWSKAWHGAVVDIDLGLERTEETLGRGNRKSLCKTGTHALVRVEQGSLFQWFKGGSVKIGISQRNLVS